MERLATITQETPLPTTGWTTFRLSGGRDHRDHRLPGHPPRAAANTSGDSAGVVPLLGGRRLEQRPTHLQQRRPAVAVNAPTLGVGHPSLPLILVPILARLHSARSAGVRGHACVDLGVVAELPGQRAYQPTLRARVAPAGDGGTRPFCSRRWGATASSPSRRRDADL